MKLSELKSILQFDTDFADTEIDASFYTEIEDILPQYADELLIEYAKTHEDYLYSPYDFTYNFLEDNGFLLDHKEYNFTY